MSVPVFILVDADPDGIAIMLNYRFGSMVSNNIIFLENYNFIYIVVYVGSIMNENFQF